MRNRQTPDRIIYGSSLQVTKIFHTIQGEGPHTGRCAVFVRLAGCNIQCPGCDTEYPNNGSMSVNDVLDAVDRLYRDSNGEIRLVVITGGEPMRQISTVDLANRIALMNGWEVQIETNGSIYPSISLSERVMVVVSPKYAPIQGEWLKRENTFLKLVVQESADGEMVPHTVLGARLNEEAREKIKAWTESRRENIYVHPMDSYNADINRGNARYAGWMALRHNLRLGVQVHKICGLD